MEPNHYWPFDELGPDLPVEVDGEDENGIRPTITPFEIMDSRTRDAKMAFAPTFFSVDAPDPKERPKAPMTKGPTFERDTRDLLE